jgi:hypothetical protein
LFSHYIDIYGNSCCKDHIDEEGSVAYCSECYKLVPAQGNQLVDGRIICKDCMSIAVSPDRTYDFMFKQVVARLNKAGFSDLKVDDITIWIATSEEMAMFKKDSVDVFNEGFCSIQNNGKIKIYIQSHHTKIHFAGVLAHELLHAWCFQHKLFNIPSAISEGFCNLASYYVYHSINFPLARIYEDMLFKNEDPIYGGGFRKMFEIYKECGWDGVRNVVFKSNNN